MESSQPDGRNILFICDVHLGAFSKQRNKKIETDLIRLIDYAAHHNYRIALLGDIFDYWIEYPDFVPSLGHRLLARFQKFHSNHPASLYITGNHDNWTLGHFSKFGFDVEPEYRILHINDQKILLLHGDATGDQLSTMKRPLMHRFIRNKYFLKIYRSVLPPGAGLGVMQKFSQMTRFLGTDPEDPSPLNNWAKKMLADTDINFIICGHDHAPRYLEYDSGTFINTGAFYNGNSLVAYNNNRFELVNWNSKDQELTSFQK